MISSIAIENFKAFGKKQKLPIKPITLIFGPNSSGKSSIIHSLLFAQHVLQTGNLDMVRTTGGGDSVDLGGFKQYIFKGNTENLLTWSVQIDTAKCSNELFEFLSTAKTLEISLSVHLPKEEIKKKEKVYNPKTKKWDVTDVPSGDYAFAVSPIVSSFTVSIDGEELFTIGARPDNMLRLERLNHVHPFFKNIFKSIIEVSTTVQNVLPEDYDYLKEGINKIMTQMEFVCEKFFPLSKLRSGFDSAYYESSLIPISRGNRKESIISIIELIVPRKISIFLKYLYNEVSGLFENLAYLGPLRSYPPRHLAFLESEDNNWYAGGGFAWEVLRKDTAVREQVNKWLGDKDKLQTPYRLEIKDFSSFDEISGDVVGFVEELERRFAEEEYDWDLFGEFYRLPKLLKQWSQKKNTIKELYLKDLRTDTTVSHRDVGIGISQLIPVLVSSYANQNKMIAIEQPEIHIHPGLQAELGDLFIESALGENKNTFVLETHSEHLILRILRRIRETTRQINKEGPNIHPEDISLIFVDSTKKGSVIKSLRVDERGRIIDKVPGGFFEEDFKELF